MSLLNKASLIQIPSGYKDGTLYSAKPTNGDGDFTFSRGSNLAATRVNSEGLIEKGRENLLLQSNSFDTTWSNVNTSETSGQTGYDGSSNAWLITLTGGTATKLITQSTSTLSGVYTASFYAKAGTHSIVQIGTSTQSNIFVCFDLSDGSVGSLSSNAINAKATSISNGWYRIEVAFLGTNANGISIAGVDSISATRFQSTSSTGNFYIQDSQLELGLTSTDVITTTTTTAQAGILEDMPRLDYSGGATCPSLLLESQRTNSVVHSEYMSSSWWNATQVSVISNSAISPDGKQNASKIVETASTSTHSLNSTFMANQVGVVSVYAKAGERRYATISKNSGGSNYGTATFDLIDGVVTQENKTATAVPSIEDAGNGWYRLSVYFTTSAAGFFSIGLSNSATYTGSTIGFNSYAGDGTSGAYFWGAQCELNSASYPTSYIPTYGASVTRGGDDALATHTISDTETLTYYTEFIAPEQTGGGGEHLIENSSGSSRIRVYQNNSTSIRIRTDSPSANFDYTYSSLGIDVGDTVKIALSVDSGVMTAFINGVKKNTFSSATINFARLHLRPQTIITYKTGIIFDSALSDDECIQLTTI